MTTAAVMEMDPRIESIEREMEILRNIRDNPRAKKCQKILVSSELRYLAKKYVQLRERLG